MKLTSKIIKKIKEANKEIETINKQIETDKRIAYDYKNIRRML